jgi:1-acyl-sn-glycerol-3-phosphate acyltransferase
VVNSQKAELSGGRGWRQACDLGGTLILWGYFTIGFVLFFAPAYLAARVFAGDTARAFQRLNRRFYRGFFRLLGRLAPAQVWRVDPCIGKIRGAVVVCNHVSYLDAILLVAMLPRHTTVAKARLFRIPIFGRMLELSGYIPASSAHGQGARVLARLEALPAELAEGNNLFVFPEGTRGRENAVGPLHKGIFKLARSLRAPLHVLQVAGTDRLFAPGRFAFHLTRPNTVTLRQLAVFTPEMVLGAESARALADRVRDLLERPADIDGARASVAEEG